MLDEDTGAPFRASIFINPEQVISAKCIYPNVIGRNVNEHVRLLKAIQFYKRTGEVVPANWVPGEPGIEIDS